MRSALLALLLGGCLIVRTNEETVEPPCPDVTPELLAEAHGPFALGDSWIYFIDKSGALAQVGYGETPISELTSDAVDATRLVRDRDNLFWITDDSVMTLPLAGGAAYPIATGYSSLSALLVDDTSVVWASATGLDRWSKADQSITKLDDATNLVVGLGAYQGVYYYSDTSNDRVRRGPPTQDLATAHFPGPLFVDANGVYFFEAGDPFQAYTGMLRLVPRDGGEVVTTARELPPTVALTADDDSLYFASAVDDEYRIKIVSRYGGTVRTVVCARFVGEAIYMDQDFNYVYWEDGRGLYRIAKDSIPPL